MKEHQAHRLLAGTALLLWSGFATAQDAFRRGDATRDGRIDVADGVHIALAVLPGGVTLGCPDAADVDDNGAILTTDASLLLGFLFLGGPSPPAPFAACGPDPTLDALAVCAYAAEICSPQPERSEDPDFEILFLGEPQPILGNPGATVTLGSFAAGLCNGDGGLDDARFLVEGWSLAVATSGCAIRDPTTRGTAGAESAVDPEGRRNGGFEKTEVASDLLGHDSGAVSAVVLSLTLPVSLEERGIGAGCIPHVLLRFDLEAQVPPAGEVKTCRLLFTDGLRGSGQPFLNLVSTASGGVKPTLQPRQFEIKAPALAAAIHAPGEVVMLGQTGVAYLSGKGSTDPRGGSALRYAWSAIPPPAGAAPEVSRRRAALTPISFPAPGAYTAELTVLGGGQFELADTAGVAIAVRRPEDLLPSLPAFASIDDDLLTALTGRPFDLVLTLTAGSPRPDFQIVGDAPQGLAIDQAGRLSWTPERDQVGIHGLSVAASNTLGEARVDLSIRVVDQFEAMALFGAGAPVEEAIGDGGGAAVREAPEVIGDRSPVPPELRLYLQIAADSERSSAREVVPDEPGQGLDRFSALRFTPERPQADAPSGAVYRSGASASKLSSEVIEGAGNFTVELWLSRVPREQPGAAGGEPAALLALMGEESSEASWNLGATGGQYVLRINALPQDVELAVPADFSGSTPHHLVFVRNGSRHSFFVDGAEAKTVDAEVTLDWSTDHELFLANNSSLSRPFAGDVHLAVFHAEALSPAHIAHLFEIGLAEPADPSPPLVFICPDPFIIGRGELGFLADASPFAGNAGAGQGGGIDGGCRESDLRETNWRLSASVPLEEGEVRLETLPPPRVCQRRARIHYDPDRAEFDLTVELEIVQVPVRGQTETGKAAYVLRLPLRRLFRRGDVNGNGSVDISDAIAALESLFSGYRAFGCRDAVDANDDGVIDVSDPIVILNHLFTGQVAIAPPGPTRCGEDSAATGGAPDDLDCSRYPEPGSPMGCPSN